MTYQDTKSMQLFDLLARSWKFATAVTGAVFNNSDTAVAFVCDDGTVSLVSTEDNESPNSRVHHAIDTGDQTIQPREGEIPAAIYVACPQQRSSSIVAYGESSFLFGTQDGQLTIVSSKGNTTVLDAGMKGAIAAVAATHDSKLICFATDNMVKVCLNKKLEILVELQTASPVVDLAISKDGSTLAVGHKTGISVWDITGEFNKLKEYSLVCPPGDICWSADGEWIASTLASNGFVLINTSSHQTRHITNFPTPVNMLAFCPAANAIATSGAFRASAWSLTQLEACDITKDGALVSGKPGLVAVNSVAANPTKNLLAVGYASGLLNLVQIAHQDEMLLNADNGVGISTLSWSRNGSYLAIGKNDGQGSIVEFPNGMFK